MFNEESLNNLRKRYSNISPIIFQRSVSFSKSLGELFDILEDIPAKYPIIWDRKQRKWVVVEDIFKLKGE